MRFHHIHELLTEKKLEVQTINTEVNIVDCLTMQLPNQHFKTLKTMMGLGQEPEQKEANEQQQKGR